MPSETTLRILCGFTAEILGLPAGRHAAACASGSIAVLGATVKIEAGRYGPAAIVGMEQMRKV